MKIYAVKILNINEKKVNDICLSINSEKRCKVEKYINKKDKIKTLVGEVLIRTIIAKKVRIKNKNITFGKNKYGKPYLKEYPKFKFNISHSGEFVVCAVDDKYIGIDIQKVEHIEYKEIAKIFFTLSEYNCILKRNLDNQLNKFYDIWTLKESYIKCYGQGLSMPLNSFSVDIDKYKNIKVTINNKFNKYVFKQFDIEVGYKMAVCSINKEISNNIIMIDQNCLIKNYLDLE